MVPCRIIKKCFEFPKEVPFVHVSPLEQASSPAVYVCTAVDTWYILDINIKRQNFERFES